MLFSQDYICDDCNVDPELSPALPQETLTQGGDEITPEHSSTFTTETLMRGREENARLDPPVSSSRRSSLENRKRKEKRKDLKTKKQEYKVVSGEESCVPR